MSDLKNISRRNWMSWSAALGLGAATLTVVAADAPDAKRLLEQSDRARGADIPGLSMNGKITEYRSGEVRNSMVLEIASDADNSLVTFVEPARVRGNKMLVRGRNMWFASPDVMKPVPISARQRMLGDASNGDIAVTRYSRDYSPELLTGPEAAITVSGRPVWVLELRAQAPGVAYDRIRYFVDKETLLGLRADFYSLGGDVLKRALMTYDESVNDGEKKSRFISKMEISDAMDGNRKTVLEYSDIKAERVPATVFNLSALTQR